MSENIGPLDPDGIREAHTSMAREWGVDKYSAVWIEWVREALIAYDVEYGSYPEHEYEGLEVLGFIMERLQKP